MTVLFLASQLQAMKKILLIDDDVTYHLILQKCLPDCMVTYVTNRADFFTSLATTDYDLVLVDIELNQGYTGFELVKEIYYESGDFKFPFVAFSASDLHESNHNLVTNGFLGFIPKSGKLAEMVSRVNLYLNQHSQAPVLLA